MNNLAEDKLGSLRHSDNFNFPHQFGGYLSPQRAYKQHMELNPDDKLTLADYKKWAKMTEAECDNCGRPIWRMVANLGMCFSCVTGESDASDDYELEPAL